MNSVDVLIVGGGIVGLATAYDLTRRYPGRKVVLLEKERELAFHQTGRNSGVLHSGIYYKPGSLRAQNCRSGKLAMEQFCAAEGVAYEICGKVIVAVAEDEIAALERILDRGKANGVKCELIDKSRLAELEPHAQGVAAIHVPESGIIDFPGVCQRLAARTMEAGGSIVRNARVTAMHPQSGSICVSSEGGDFDAKYVVTCAGLQSDRLARMSGQQVEAKIVPFRGEYYELKPQAQHLCRNLIYPVPDPKFPFLGVHFTRLIHGGVECGPNAVLAFAREGYRMRDISIKDLAESLTYPGFLRLAAKHWRTASKELWRSFSKNAFTHALERLVPEIRTEDLTVAPSGVRAQAVARDGSIIDDFWILETECVVNVCNAPSPAATAALNIGKLVVDRLAKRWSS
ncbi:MAG: L-2-hydroxyglutarate oxidase [Pirellulales bacterium]|nr:L-2-hydroxyglutarate oxidase [Pirellulales bacterium]